MVHFFADLFLFWLKALGLIAFLLIGLALFVTLLAKIKLKNRKGMLVVEHVSEKYAERQKTLTAEVYDKKILKQWQKELKALRKKAKDEADNRLYILNFKGDLHAHQAESLAEDITALLQIAKPDDEVLLRLESPGGVVQGYGLAAAQLVRIRDHGLKLTVAVDQVAASGGYLMASVAHEIIASPFAIIGSIGVIAQIPNFNRLLEKQGVDFEQITAGKSKRTVTMFGKNTEEDRKKLKAQLELIHSQFKAFIETYRPLVDIEMVANGDYWLAHEAMKLKLVDRMQLSDDFILAAYQRNLKIYEISHLHRKSFGFKISKLLSQILSEKVLLR